MHLLTAILFSTGTQGLPFLFEHATSSWNGEKREMDWGINETGDKNKLPGQPGRDKRINCERNSANPTQVDERLNLTGKVRTKVIGLWKLNRKGGKNSSPCSVEPSMSPIYVSCLLTLLSGPIRLYQYQRVVVRGTASTASLRHLFIFIANAEGSHSAGDLRKA